MKKIKLTVAIPTWNRAKLLKRAINSILCQTFKDYELIVIDNASNDETKSVVLSLNKDVHYIRNDSNLGIINNWNKCIEVARGKYLNIFHDDDIMLPNFLEKSISVLEDNPTVGFTFPLIMKVDIFGKSLGLWWNDYNNRKGFIKGVDYLLMTIDKETCISLAPTMVFRKKIFKKIGYFKQVYGYNTFDFNKWLSICKYFDAYFIPEILVKNTVHTGQMTERHWRNKKLPTGRISSCLEIIDSVAYLLNKSTMQQRYYYNNKYFSKKLMNLNNKLKKSILAAIPEL